MPSGYSVENDHEREVGQLFALKLNTKYLVSCVNFQPFVLLLMHLDIWMKTDYFFVYCF